MIALLSTLVWAKSPPASATVTPPTTEVAPAAQETQVTAGLVVAVAQQEQSKRAPG